MVNFSDYDPRRPPRGPVSLTIEYRSAGAFLIAYATNLSMGVFYVETNAPLPAGTAVTLKLQVPGAQPIEIQGQVAWGRAEAQGPMMPAGMGIEIATPPDQYGATIDQMAFGFSGLQILLGTGDAAPRAILNRYLRSVLTCEITEVDYLAPPDRLPVAIDLAVVDLDSSGVRGDHLLQHLRAQPQTRTVPMVALAQLERDRVRAQKLGAQEALTNPPSFAELQATVVRCLARPIQIR